MLLPYPSSLGNAWADPGVVFQTHMEKSSLCFQINYIYRDSASSPCHHYAIHCHTQKTYLLVTTNSLQGKKKEAYQENVLCFSKDDHLHLTITIPNSGDGVDSRVEIGTSSPTVQEPLNFQSYLCLLLIIRWVFTFHGGDWAIWELLLILLFFIRNF